MSPGYAADLAVMLSALMEDSARLIQKLELLIRKKTGTGSWAANISFRSPQHQTRLRYLGR